MATTTSSRPLMGLEADDPENDADTGESGSSDFNNENSQTFFDGKQTESDEKNPLSMRRRIAFVAALLLCVFTVFAFAFLLPCHKPKCQTFPACPGKGDQSSANWTEKFSGITPGRISLIDVTGNGRPDILVEFEIEEFNNSLFLNQLCKNENCHGSGVLAIDGSCGNNLWIFRRNSSFGLLSCEREPDGKDSDRHCLLLEEKLKLFLLTVGNGTAKWQFKSPLTEKISSFKFVNDVDGDNVRDIVFVREQRNNSNKGNVNLLSGKTGKAIGGSLPLPEGHGGSNVLAVHNSAQQFVIIGSVSKVKKNSSLWAISLHDLSKRLRNPMKKISGEPWGKRLPDPMTGFISIVKESLVLVQPLVTDLDGDGVKDVVFVIRENGTSLLALKGNDLVVLWKIAVPSNSSIHKLLQTPHPVKEHSTDVVVFIKSSNHSSSLLVVDGQSGKLTWIFHSKSGLPVAPIPVPSVLGSQQPFVIWLPKVESKILIPKERKASQFQQESYGDYKDGSRMADEYKKHKKMPRHKRQVDELDGGTSLEWKHLHEFFPYDNDDEEDREENVDDDNNDGGNYDDDDDDDDFEASNESDLELRDDIDNSPLSKEQFFATYMRNKVDHALLSRKKEQVPVLPETGYGNIFFPSIKKPAFPDTVAEVGPQKETFDETADSDFRSKELETELSDLTNRRNSEPPENHEKTVVSENGDQKKDKLLSVKRMKIKRVKIPKVKSQKNEDSLVRSEIKDETLASGQKKEIKFANRSKDEAFIVNHKVAADARVHSISENRLKSTFEGSEADFQEASMSDLIRQKSPFLTESDKKENSNLEPGKKPAYHKRSLQTSLQCVRSSDDEADTYVALLLLRDLQGRQQIFEITEETPLYLDSQDYESLFNVKKSDAKLTPCLRLVPSLTSGPVLRETEEGLDLVYTVSFVSEDLSLHLGKVRKISMTQVFERLKRKKNLKTAKHQFKRENDYSFSFPRIMK